MIAPVMIRAVVMAANMRRVGLFVKRQAVNLLEPGMNSRFSIGSSAVAHPPEMRRMRGEAMIVLRYAMLTAILATFTAAIWLAVAAPESGPRLTPQAAHAALCLGSGMGCGPHAR